MRCFIEAFIPCVNSNLQKILNLNNASLLCRWFQQTRGDGSRWPWRKVCFATVY